MKQHVSVQLPVQTSTTALKLQRGRGNQQGSCPYSRSPNTNPHPSLPKPLHHHSFLFSCGLAISLIIHSSITSPCHAVHAIHAISGRRAPSPWLPDHNAPYIPLRRELLALCFTS